MHRRIINYHILQPNISALASFLFLHLNHVLQKGEILQFQDGY